MCKRLKSIDEYQFVIIHRQAIFAFVLLGQRSMYAWSSIQLLLRTDETRTTQMTLVAGIGYTKYTGCV